MINEKNRGGSYNPQVEVRFDSLAGEFNRTDLWNSEQKIDEVVEVLRRKIDQIPVHSSIKSTVERLIDEYVFRDLRLLPGEFLELFERAGLAKFIADKFLAEISSAENSICGVRRLKGDEIVDGDNSEIRERVKKKMMVFLERNKLSSSNTFYEFLQVQCKKYPMINIVELFDEEVMSKFVEKIKLSFRGIAEDKYREMLGEDKRGFVLALMMGRVMKVDLEKKEQSFDSNLFRKLLGFLDRNGVGVEQLGGDGFFNLLIEERRNQRSYLNEEKVLLERLGVRDDVSRVQKSVEVMDGDELFFSDNFNFAKFFNEKVAAEIYKYNTEKLNSLAKLRLMDLFQLNGAGLSRVVYSRQHVDMLMSLVRLYKKNRVEFMEYLKDVLGYDSVISGEEVGLEDVEKNICKSLEMSEKMIRRNVADALEFRGDLEIKNDCSYFEEILGCRDVGKLILWLATPTKFFSCFPKYKKVDPVIVRHQCRIMLHHLLFVDAKMYDEEIRSISKKREMLEEYFKNIFKINGQRALDVRFRVLEELNEAGELTGKYLLQTDYAGLKAGLQTVLTSRQELELEGTGLMYHEGKMYKRNELESKSFVRVILNVPYWAKNFRGSEIRKTNREVEVLIYSGDGNLIHSKDFVQMLLSSLRKEVSDENRWMIVCSDSGDVEALKSFFYDRDPRSVVKVDDFMEGRRISAKKITGVAASSNLFKSGQHLQIASRISMLKKVNGELVKISAPLETQILNLEHTLISNLSDYTLSGHPRYRAKRAWELMNLYFDPFVWGKKFQTYKEQGFDFSDKRKNLVNTIICDRIFTN